MFGGQDPSTGVCFNDVVVLDTTRWEWRRLVLALERVAASPERAHRVRGAGRRGARGVRRLVPGAGPDGGRARAEPGGGCEKWDRPRVAGQAPSRARCTPACSSPKEELLVAGGRGRDGVVFRDAHVLDVRLMKWTRAGGFRGAGLRARRRAVARPGRRKRRPPSAGGGKRRLRTAAALRASSDLSLLEPTTLAKTVLSGDDRQASRDAFRASKTKIPQARFAPACVAVDVARRAARRACSWFSGGSRRRSTWRTSPRGWTRAIIRRRRARERGGDRGRAIRPRSRGASDLD